MADTKRATFLSLLERNGNVTLAAEGSAMSRAQAYRLRAIDPTFAEQWEAALQLGISALEDRALEMALAGSEKLTMFLLQSHRPERYNPRQIIDVSHNVTVGIRRALVDDLRKELHAMLATSARIIDQEPERTNVIDLPLVDR